MAKRDAYEAQFKLKAISHAEEHGNRAAAREFKINESMVRKWRKMENKLRQVKKTQLSFRGHKARWPELEERLERWIIEQRTSGASVSTVTVRRKAVTLAEEMKIEHFQGGPSWCFRFMKRCHFSIRTRTKVAQQRPADYNEKRASFHSYCSQHIADKLIQPSHITKMDEMPLTFDIPLNHTVEKKGTSTVAMHTTGYEHRNQICSTPVKDSAPPPGPSVNESSDHDRENTDDAFKSRRCSVVRCDSWRRGAQCFSLPADPDKRLEWVQFLFLVNGQRITESSWVDIRVCAEHFTPSCFLQVNPATSIALLNTDAVPSVYRPAEPEVKQETIEPIDADFKLEQLKPHDSPTPGSSALVKDETSTLSAPGSPALSKVSESSESGYCKMLQEIMEKVNLLHKTKKYIVSEKQLLQLFSAECPLCQSKVKTEKLVHGALLVLNQQCLQCSYSKHWKNLSEKSVSAFLDDHQTECLEISLETSLDETATISDKDQTVKEESDHKEEMDESSNTDEVEKSDVNWEPEDKSLILDSDKDYNSSAAHTEESAPKQRELCTECGTFFETRVPHICEYKIKPFSCNICGKRCVSEQALAVHSNIHVRMNTEERPYKCQHCNKGFIYNVSLEIHLKRFHTESENQGKTTNLKESVGGEPEGDEGTDSLYENVEEDHTAEEEVWTGGGGFKKMRTTGKPIGRPKKDIKDTTVEEEKEQKQDKNTKTAKGRKRKPKSRQSSSEDDEEELCESEESLDLTEDEEKNNEKVTSRQKANEDLDFDPTEMKNRERKKVCKTPKRPRGRPRKKAVC